MTTTRFYFHNDTRRLMRDRARRVFVRQLLGGIALFMVAAFSIGYFGA